MRIVADLLSTDRTPKPTPSMLRELNELEVQAFSYNQPIVHQVKNLMKQYPNFPDPGCLLVAMYDILHKKQQALDLMKSLHQQFPQSPEVLSALGQYLFDQEDYDQMESLADFSLSFEQQFPTRQIVAMQEWYPYEVLSVEWLITNDETTQAYERIRKILEAPEELLREWQVFKDLIELIEEYFEPEEYTPETHELLQTMYRKLPGANYHPAPPFQHPEIRLLRREVFPSDIPTILELLKLPHTSLLTDLRTALQDMYRNDFYYRKFAPVLIQPDLPIVGFLMLAELSEQSEPDEPGALDEWLNFLHQPAPIIEFWMEDLLLEIGYLISWKLSRNQPGRMKKALCDEFEHHWSASMLATGLITTWLRDPEKQPEIMVIFEHTCRQLFKLPTNDGRSNLLATILHFGVAMAPERFIPLVQEAYALGRLDQSLYGNTPEELIAESAYWADPDQSIEYQRSLLPLEKLLEWLLTG